MNEDATVAQDLYAVIIEASLHSRAVWEAFTNHQDASRLHHALLLADPRQCVRQHVARKVASVCGGDLPFTCPLTKGEIASSFWSLVSAILPRVEQYPEQAQQLFEISEQVFRANDEYDRNEDVLRSLLVRWGRLLLNHAHKEFVGRDEVDHVVLGFSKLLLCCILSIKSFKKPLNAGDLMEQVFKKYIFVQRYVEKSPIDSYWGMRAKTL
jgi:ubiquitin carboxyl-terminal hydrolase 34